MKGKKGRKEGGREECKYVQKYILVACSLQNSRPHNSKLSFSEDIRYSCNSFSEKADSPHCKYIYLCIYANIYICIPMIYETGSTFQCMGILSMEGISQEGSLLPCEPDYKSCSD